AFRDKFDPTSKGINTRTGKQENVTLEEGAITRVLPSFRLKGGMTFERDQQWFGEGANQTLEPEFQYLYVPYKDQDNIGVYDSTTMRQDYYSL
ncbi:TPA: LPS assembly protein LptD, partial [Vibrio cholerae O1]